MKKVKWLLFVIAVFILSFISYKYVMFKEYKVDQADSKDEIIQVFKENESPVYLKNAFPFEWTEAYIFNGYTSEEHIKEKIKAKWIPQDTFIEYLFSTTDYSLQHDGRTEIIFIHSGRVVRDSIFDVSDFSIKEKHLTPNDQLIVKDKKNHIYSK